MRVLTVPAVAGLLLFTGHARADKIGPPSTYKTLSANGKFVFVMLAPEPADQELRRYNEDHQKLVKAIRDLYNVSGLYRNDGSNDPLWTAEWYKSGVKVASDGIHAVGHGRPAALGQKGKGDRSITNDDLKQEAVSFYAKGKLLRQVSIGELVDDPTKLPKSVSHFKWTKLTKLHDDASQFEIITHDRNRILIDLATAKIVEKTKVE
jgi:hypothetical protein